MSKTFIPDLESHLIVNNTQYEVVPRRRFERRSVNDLPAIKPEFAPENEDMEVQKEDGKHADLSREDQRRQSDRRTSRPALLSVDDIAKLRKK